MGDKVDEIAVTARRMKMRAVQDDPMAEWLASRLVKGIHINAFASPDHVDRMREVFQSDPLVTVIPCKYLPDGERVFFAEDPDQQERLGENHG